MNWDSPCLRFESHPHWAVRIGPSLQRIMKYVGVGMIGIIICSGAAWIGWDGVISGVGAAQGEGPRGMTPRSTEALLVAWVLLIVGTGGLGSVSFWFFWNGFVVESARLTGDALVIRRSVLGLGIERTFARSSLRNVR